MVTEKIILRSYNELELNERFQAGHIFDDEQDEHRFFELNGEFFDLYMMDVTDEDEENNVRYCDYDTPGRWMGGYNRIIITLDGKNAITGTAVAKYVEEE